MERVPVVGLQAKRHSWMMSQMLAKAQTSSSRRCLSRKVPQFLTLFTSSLRAFESIIKSARKKPTSRQWTAIEPEIASFV
jgi:hypothetical protein